MRIEKENEFTSFSKLLTKINTANLGQYELKVLKQEHDYLDRLRHQRMRIEELKNKYDICESELNQQRQTNNQLNGMLEEKCQIIENLENQLRIEIGRRQSLEKTVQKQLQTDKNKSKTRVKELENQNEELKRIIRQKQLLIISMDQEYDENIKKLNISFQSERRSLVSQFEERLNQTKSKNTDNEVLELRNLVSRQNKALKLQNQKFTQLSEKNQHLTSELEEMKQSNSDSESQIQQYQQKLQQLYEEIESLQCRLEKQDQNNKLKGQLEQVRRKMTEMQKGELERIEFIVNQMQ